MTAESVGPSLKHARESQGLSLDQVASLTRIQLKYLQAIEEEHFAALPEQVFTKGFVRTYARALGMDEHDILRRFSRAWNEYFGMVQHDDDVQVNIREEKGKKPNRTLWMIIMVVLVFGVGLYLSRQQEPTSLSTPETQENSSDASSLPIHETETETFTSPPMEEAVSAPKVDIERVSVSEVVPEPPSVDLPRIATPPKPEKPQAPAPSRKPGPLLMELEATQLTWVVVKSDQGEPKEALLQPKERTTWKAKKQFTLTLGNAGGVRIWLNGESRGPFGKQGEIVREVVIKD